LEAYCGDAASHSAAHLFEDAAAHLFEDAAALFELVLEAHAAS
jgi:hypothetical protein